VSFKRGPPSETLPRGRQPQQNSHQSSTSQLRYPVWEIAEDHGIGVDIQGQTKSITIANNEIREAQAPGQRVGIRIGPEAAEITLTDNQIEGFSEAVRDLRKKPA
jgi:hypothetical protein